MINDKVGKLSSIQLKPLEASILCWLSRYPREDNLIKVLGMIPRTNNRIQNVRDIARYIVYQEQLKCKISKTALAAGKAFVKWAS